MPIKALQNNYQSGRGYPQIARLFKGGPMRQTAKGKNYPGPDLDYFRVEFTDQFKHLANDFEMLYGSQPKSIRGLRLPGHDADTAFPTWLEQWKHAKMVRRCDGENIVLWYDLTMNDYRTVLLPCKQAEGCQCKEIGRLSFILPEFLVRTGVLGVFSLVISSKHELIGVYNYLRDINQQFRDLSSVPFVLSRTDKEVTMKMDKGRTKKMRSMVTLEVDRNWTQIQYQQGNLLGDGQSPELMELPEGELTSENENELILDDKVSRPVPVGEVMDALLYSVEVKKLLTGDLYLKLSTSMGDALAYHRQLFIRAGYITPEEWMHIGEGESFEDDPLRIQLVGKLDESNTYYVNLNWIASLDEPEEEEDLEIVEGDLMEENAPVEAGYNINAVVARTITFYNTAPAINEKIEQLFSDGEITEQSTTDEVVDLLITAYHNRYDPTQQN